MLAFVVCSDLGKIVEVISDILEERPGFYFFRVSGFNIVGVFSNYEVKKGHIAKSELFFSNEFVQEIKFSLVFFNEGSLGSLVVLVEEKSLDCSSNF